MSTPSHLKPPIARWIQGERKRAHLKPKDVADRLKAMGLDVGEQTVRVWESNAGRKPNAANLDGLERIFGSKAPVEQQFDQAALIAQISDLVEELRQTRLAQAEWAQAVTEAVATLVESQRDGAPKGGPSSAPLAGAQR